MDKAMKPEEIVQALRCVSAPGGPTGDCTKCLYWKKEQLNEQLKEKLGTDTRTSCDADKIGMDAAALIELTADLVYQLRKELEWKDMVIALAQRKQTKAEAERDALLGYAKTIAGCSACKHADCYHCNGDCNDCELGAPADCVCKSCERGSCWEWRGLSEASEKGNHHEPET